MSKQSKLLFGNPTQGESSRSNFPEKRLRPESPDYHTPRCDEHQAPPPSKLSFWPPRVEAKDKDEFSYNVNYHQDDALTKLRGPNSLDTKHMMAQIYTNNYNSQRLHESLTAQLHTLHELVALQSTQFIEHSLDQELRLEGLQKQVQTLVSRPTPPSVISAATTVSSPPVTQPPPQHKPAPLNAKAQQFQPGKATTTTKATATPKPAKTVNATEAKDNNDAGFTKVTHKKQQQKKKKKETLLPQPLPVADRKCHV
jgi:hypothetical protein